MSLSACVRLFCSRKFWIIWPLNGFYTSAFQVCASENVMGTFYQVMMIIVKTRDNDIGVFFYTKHVAVTLMGAALGFYWVN